MQDRNKVKILKRGKEEEEKDEKIKRNDKREILKSSIPKKHTNVTIYYLHIHNHGYNERCRIMCMCADRSEPVFVYRLAAHVFTYARSDHSFTGGPTITLE